MHGSQTYETLDHARGELQRAYLLVSYGRYEEAREACRSADAALGGEHHLPRALEGSFLTAAGELPEAIGHLREVVRDFPDEALPRIYFAEACLLAGRKKQGWRSLRKARKLESVEECRELLEELEATWEDVDPDDVPSPLVVPERAAAE